MTGELYLCKHKKWQGWLFSLAVFCLVLTLPCCSPGAWQNTCVSHIFSFLFSPSLHLWIGNDWVCLLGSDLAWIFWVLIFYSAAFQGQCQTLRSVFLLSTLFILLWCLKMVALLDFSCAWGLRLTVCVVFSCSCIGVSVKSVILTSETLERFLFPVNLNQSVA